MTDDVLVRDAEPGDVAAICAFGARVVPDHYRPLIGDEAARRQVEQWWTPERIGATVSAGEVVVAERAGQVVGVGERGTWEGDHVIWKLYVDPELRGRGVGPRLIAGLVAHLPEGATRICVEHFAANERAGLFYEREGFRLMRTAKHPSDPAQHVVWRVREIGGG